MVRQEIYGYLLTHYAISALSGRIVLSRSTRLTGLHRIALVGWETAGMVFVADDLTSWLIGVLADAGHKKLTTFFVGSEQERALRSTATAAIQLTAQELRPEIGERAEELAMVVSQVFRDPVPAGPPTGQATVLGVLQAGIAGQLAVLDDARLTGTGQSSADVLGVPGMVVAANLTSHLVREIMVRGARGGPLAPLADQLNHDISHLQGQRIEDILGRLDNEVREALARLDTGQAVEAVSRQVAGHVFISYVREDSHRVDQLQRTLQAAGIPVWRDTVDLSPGEDWRTKIRQAITDNALVFIACFSRASLARGKSYQNEELTLAIEQLRLRNPEVPWLIPVRFDDCDIPDREIGGGRTLTSIQRADVFGDRYDEAARRLVAAVTRILGGHSDATHLTITEPRALVLNGTTRYRDLEQWLSHPVRPGQRGGSPALPVRGRVEPSPSGGQIRIRIYTDQWYPQDNVLIDENGDFNGMVYINKQRPQARWELTVVSADGTPLLRQFANLA